MKAIVTGFTADMARGSSRVGFESLSLGLTRICKDLHWDVSHQPMMVDTNDADLKEADILFMGIAPFNAVGSRYLFGAMDAIAKARANDCALVFYVTDWQTHLLNSSIKTMLKKPHNLAKFFMRARTDFTWGAHNIEYLNMILETFKVNPWPETIVPVHTWFQADYSGKKLVEHLPARRLSFIDPTQYTTRTWPVAEIDQEHRTREWTMAALGDYSDWITNQQLEWPVRYFGGKTHIVDPADPDAKVVNQRITEAEVNANYRQTWGGLSPKHSLSGTAWWRTRYDFILSNGGILHGDSSELWPIGSAFQHNVHEIERLNDSQLVDLQRSQREQFEVQIMPKEQIKDEILCVVQRAFHDIGKVPA